MTGGAGGQTVAPVRGRGSDASVMIGVGTRLVWDGELRTVVGLAADGMLLRGPGRGIVRVQTTALLADPSTRVIDGGVAGAAQAPPAIGPLLEDLDAGEDRLLDERLGHVREVLTGYASGCAEQAAAGEPRAG